jgi:hypothetical protein
MRLDIRLAANTVASSLAPAIGLILYEEIRSKSDQEEKLDTTTARISKPLAGLGKAAPLFPFRW